MTLCRWWKPQTHCDLKQLDYLPMQFVAKWWISAILAWRLSLSRMPTSWPWYYDLLTMNLFIFPCCWHQILNLVWEYIYKKKQFISLNIKYSVFILYSIEYQMKVVYKWLHSVHFAVSSLHRRAKRNVLRHLPTTLMLGMTREEITSKHLQDNLRLFDSCDGSQWLLSVCVGTGRQVSEVTQ